jgi:asparagine synthase (glutamine-hydrolysing)
VSGILAIIDLDGAPMDDGLLRKMTASMAFRGPDAQETVTDSHVGLGHAMLRTTSEVADERQPKSLGGRLWITADARLDAREKLIHKLRSRGHIVERATDAELILKAYSVWGTGCINHFIGDFSFAIWDRPQQRLFCARDQFGVRPFYYAKVSNRLIISNDLGTIRRHPQVSDKLNELAIVNLLLFRYQPRIDQTAFSDINALMPAHMLICESGHVTISRYWTLPIEGPIHYKRFGDYVDHFRELLDVAVADRMRTDRAGILMSGGLDSPSIAATIHCLGKRGQTELSLKAFTYVYDRLIPDKERHYAALVARSLDMPIRFISLDNQRWFNGWERAGFCFPEPMVNWALWNENDGVRIGALDDGLRVFYCGMGPDVMLNEPTHFGALLRHRRIGDAVKGASAFVRRFQRRPLAGARQLWRRLTRRYFDERHVDSAALDLLTAEILATAPKKWWQFAEWPARHPWRPGVYSLLTDYYWTLALQQYDSANWRAPVEFRFPYFDLRLVQYLLRVPVLPWASNKGLLREAMRDRLVESVRIRPKAPLAGQPIHSYADWVQGKQNIGSDLERYVDAGKAAFVLSGTDRDPGATIKQRIVAVDHWLQRYRLLPTG